MFERELGMVSALNEVRNQDWSLNNKYTQIITTQLQHLKKEPRDGNKPPKVILIKEVRGGNLWLLWCACILIFG